MLEKLSSKESGLTKSNNQEIKPYIPQQLNFRESEIKDKEEADDILKQLEDTWESNNNIQERFLGEINSFLYGWGIDEIIKSENRIGKFNQFTEEEKQNIIEARNWLEFDLYSAFEVINNNFDDNDINFLKNLVEENTMIEINGEDIKFDDFLSKLKIWEIKHPMLKSCSWSDDVYADKNNPNYNRKKFPQLWRQKINWMIIEDNTNEINELKNRLITKDNMSEYDKSNMQMCIDFILGWASGSLNSNWHHVIIAEQLKKLDNIQYGPNYIEIWWVKYHKEPVLKDWNYPKLITWEEYIEALKQQNKKWITVEDIYNSTNALPEKTMLWVILWVWDEWEVWNQKIIRWLIWTTDFETKWDMKVYKWYCMTIDKHEKNMCASIWPSWEDPIATVSKFYWLAKE